MLSLFPLLAAGAANARPSVPMSQELTSRLSAGGLFERASCSSTQQSCHNTTAQNTCCFNAPGGLFLQTQFWDTDPSTGPDDSWTIHGLWPDNCDGTYDENCDDRTYDIGTLMQAHAPAIYTYMQTYWVDIDGENEQFWEHEWETHGTCISTLKVACYGSDYYTGQEAVEYFKKIVALFKTLTTYDFLSAAGITPSDSKTYTLAQLNAAAKSGYGKGFAPLFECDGSTLNAVEWFFNVEGTVPDGTYVQVAPIGSSSCPSSGISYPTKSGSGSGGGGGGSGGSGSGSAPSSGDKGNLLVNDGSSQTGCILSKGTWSVQTCASFTATKSGSGFTLKGSKGYCAVSNDALDCTASNGDVFTFASDGTLSSGSTSSFYANAVPSGSDQETVYDDSGSETITIYWSAA